MNLYDMLDLRGKDGRPSHSKIFSTIGFLGGGVFIFLRCHDFNATWLALCLALFGMPYGFSAYKLFLLRKDAPSVSDPS